MEVFGGCNYTCKMCSQSSPDRSANFKKKMFLNNFDKDSFEEIYFGEKYQNLAKLIQKMSLIKQTNAKIVIFYMTIHRYQCGAMIKMRN